MPKSSLQGRIYGASRMLIRWLFAHGNYLQNVFLRPTDHRFIAIYRNRAFNQFRVPVLVRVISSAHRWILSSAGCDKVWPSLSLDNVYLR